MSTPKAHEFAWRQRTLAVALLAILGALAFSAGAETSASSIPHGEPVPAALPASHNTHWVLGGAPFTGRWGFTGDTSTIPPNHHRPYGGDWAVDFYQVPFTHGHFRVTHSAGLARWGRVVANRPACADPAVDGGRVYRIDVHDSTGRRGQYIISHVWPHDQFGQPFTLPVNTTLGDGAFLGQTYRFAYSSCYRVRTDAGVHWHLEMSNMGAAIPTHNACYFPTHSLGATVQQGAALGAIGSNAIGTNQPCW